MVGHTTYDYTGESAIVTGSTRGIGRGIATALAEHDADVLVVSRTPEDVEATVRELDALGDGDVVGAPADVAEPAEIEAMVETAVDAFGAVDLLVNNAAVWPMEDNMVEAALEDWNRTLAVNVTAQFHASVLVARHMIQADVAGNIVNVTSQTGDRRTGGRGIYGVSNTAVNGFTWRLAHDLAGHGIRVNAVSTDLTETSQVRYEADLAAEDDPDRSVDLPLGRLGRPTDLADAVMFLASDRAAYVVGTVLRVSGGGNLQ
jgi:NAD(P)-dependent dehydrogenase (short-subunit alcohol dehydrogenase family)